LLTAQRKMQKRKTVEEYIDESRRQKYLEKEFIQTLC